MPSPPLTRSAARPSSKGKDIARAPTPSFATPICRSGLTPEPNVALEDTYSSWLSDELFSPLLGQESSFSPVSPKHGEYATFNSALISDIHSANHATEALNELSNFNVGPSSLNQEHYNEEFVSDNLDDFIFDDSSTALSSASVAPSHSSADSTRSRASSISKYKKGRRKQRKVTSSRFRSHQNFVVRKYQCTFCTDTFKTKYDWQRHEASIHLSLEQWE